LIAAADPTGDAVLLWAAANRLGINASAAAPALAARLVELDEQVSFCHPLLRAVVYQAAPVLERRNAHRVLADVTDPDTDPDRRAWHRAQAASDADDTAAMELEQTAEHARSRGGLPAASAFRARAAELTADPGRRARRALTAAEMNHQAGASGVARRLLAIAQAGPLDDADSARAQLLRARLAARSERGSGTSLLLVRAAQRLTTDQSVLASQAYSEALDAVLTAGRLGSRDAVDVALSVRSASWPRLPDGAGLLLEGAAILASEGHAQAAPLVKQALDVFRGHDAHADDAIWWLPLACRMAQVLWDDSSWLALSNQLVMLTRHAGALDLLPEALNSGAIIQLLCAGCDVAIPMADEADAVGLATHSEVAPYGRLMSAAWGGSVSDTQGLIDASAAVAARGAGAWLTASDVATAVVNNGTGRYADALVAAERGCERPGEFGLATWSSVELIEAAVRLGTPERAAHAIRLLSVSTDASATDWALGIMDRSRALLESGEVAENLYRNAIERLGQTLVRADLGRAHLLYGEWLRREGRRSDAREQLRTAHDMLSQLGFAGFVERARRELVGTGGSPRKRTTVAYDLLTAQEAQIARMAREARTNAEIGVELYISPRTVEWHMRNVFVKLGISSRRQLGEALPA
jgi:DNA-binding CsgD family transcriptional regulator